MRAFFFFYIFLFFITGSIAMAQAVPDVKSPRILILLDESSSMVEKWGNEKRYQVADRIILDLMDSVYKVNDQVEFSLRVFGHQYTVPENNCYDTKNEVMFSKDNYTQMSLRLASITPLGVTPIAYALKEAAENDLVDERKYAYSIILITDGGESCGGNLCDVVKTLLQRKIDFKPYIISLVDYAPLRTQYDCLGNYLQVTANGDVPKTVSTIVQAYRPMLKPVKHDNDIVKKIPVVQEPIAEVPKPKPPVTEAPKPIVKADIPKPVEPKIELPVAPPVKQLVEKMPVINTLYEVSYVTHYVRQKTVVVPHFVPINIQPDALAPVVVAPPPPAPVIPPPPPHIKSKESTLTMRRQLKELSYFSDEPIPNVIYNLPPTRPVTVTIIPDAVATVPAPKPTPTPTKPPVKKPTKPTAPVVKKDEGKEVPFTVETEDAKETSVEIFLTNGKGKFYYTSPQVMVNDPKTGEAIQKFYRTLDASNTPDAQKMKDGNYNIVIGGKSSMIVRNINVQPNKINKIMVVVNNGTLKFEYKNAPDRPITEFQAVVVLRTDRGGPVIRQKCSVELGYDPGNYFIEINTLPVSRRNEDIDPGSESILAIDEPGYVQFTNTNRLGSVSLYTPLGDMFAKFHTIEITGNLAGQKLQIQPGTYQAHFFKDPSKPFAQETINTFNVKSNQTTEVELK
ncbi:MAG: hypothetical protein P4L41_15510 [Flavipsychrobacter sp.]|nr:hypothetical protein [Flavipsychrobacter sp.]